MSDAPATTTHDRPPGDGPRPDAAPGGFAARRRWFAAERWEQSRFGRLFGADLRSLAAFRIAMAFIVLMDMIGRWPNLRIHYTDEGIMPRDLVVDNVVRWRWSLNLANDTYGFQAAMLLLTVAAALCMMAGYRTRLMTIAVWVLIVSIQVRNPFVLSGADSLLRVLLFWAMFLPLGAVWSVDRTRGNGAVSASKQFLSFGTIGLFLQIALMYWFTAALKTGAEWRTEGTALYYATGAGHITKPFGEYLHQFPELLRIMTHASLGLEVVAPILLFCPFLTAPVRMFAIASIMAFHAGIYLTMDVGIFPWTSALCMFCFLPAWFWDTVVPNVRARLPAPFERMSTSWRSLAGAARNQWEPIRARLGDQRLMLSATGGTGDRYAPASAPLEQPEHRAEPDLEERAGGSTLRSSPVVNVFLAFCIGFVFLWNWTSVSDFEMPSESHPFAYGAGLYQSWNMFAPYPSKGTTWIVIRGVLEDGRDIDLLTPIVNEDLERVPVLTWDRPDDIVGEYYGDKYWRKYLTAIGAENRDDERRALAAYTCRTWNGHYGGDVRLVGLQMFRMSERTLPDYEDAPTTRSMIAEYRCG